MTKEKENKVSGCKSTLQKRQCNDKAKKTTKENPALAVIEEARRARKNCSIKTVEDEREVMVLCKQAIALHEKCVSLIKENKAILDKNTKLFCVIKEFLRTYKLNNN